MSSRLYKRPKKAAVSLTSLLDLLFVMIFVSMLQQKSVSKQEVKQEPKPITKTETSPKPVPKPVKVVHTISAIFNFYSVPQNPGLPQGSYRMQGRYDEKTGNLSLGGLEWINRPKNYDMVPLQGKIDSSGSMFTGRIVFIGCKKFTLRRVKEGTGQNPLSGAWEGIYECGQGPTGLTLLVD